MASLPWARLHALKDYQDMVALAVERPGLRVTFNLVPSLLDQLLDLAAGKAVDPALMMARRDADALGPDEQIAVLDLFFSVPYRTLIAPFPRYAALYHKRGVRGPDGTYAEAARRFKSRDYRDLMVWFHLAWCGETLRRRPEVRELVRKGESYSEAEKAALLDLQQEFLRGVVPFMTSAAAAGAIEASTSPYYHPILPLLCDTDSALEALPHLPVPRPAFRRSGDAAEQIRAAVSRHEEVFGGAPAGMWPSEGSLSEEAVRLIGAAGLRWTASDEGILAAALALQGSPEVSGGRPSPGAMCCPWRLRGEGPAIFFRDRELSDLVGFTYAAWPGERAAEDLVARLLRTRDALGAAAAGAVVPVILDGENAWEHYADNGAEFLRALYRRLAETEGIRPTTFTRYLAESPEPRRLDRLRAGSWIRSDFTTWIGGPEKNRAWDLLRDARDAFDHPARPVAEEARRTAWRCLLAAEGSDWFWWYGEEHSSEEDPIFDASFRDLLREAYRLLGDPPPRALSEPIAAPRRPLFERPTGVLSPVLDGRLSDYFEWLHAGVCEASSGFGAMGPGVAPLERVAFGWGPGHLYVRIDPLGGSSREVMHGGELAVQILRPAPRRVVIRCAAGSTFPVPDPPEVRCAAGRVVEVAIPLSCIGAKDGDTLAFAVSFESAAAPITRFPRDGEIEIEAAPPTDWSV